VNLSLREGRLPQRLASIIAFLIALVAAVAAPDLPELVPFKTVPGRSLALVTLGILIFAIAWGTWQGWRRRAALQPLARLMTRRRRLVAAGLGIWLFAAIHPVHLDRLTGTEIYRVIASILAPLAGLVLTVAATGRLANIARPRSWPRAGIAAVVALAGAALIGVFVLERAPHIPDEIAYLFDARSLAAGHRVATPPPVPAAFPAPEWIELETDRAYGVFPPGWPLVLALGFLAGAPWLVNPLIACGLVLLVSRLAVRNSDAGASTSRAAAWLLATSPFVLFMGGSFMAHPAAMMWTALALVSYLGYVEGRPLTGAVALPVASALLLLTRPIDAAALLLAIAADALMRGAGARRRRGLMLMGAGLAAAGVITLLDNARLTGSALEPPVSRYFDTHYHPGANRLGFGADVGLTWDFSPPGHTPLEALWNLSLNLEHLNRHLFGWPSGSHVLALFFLLGVRKTRGEKLLLLHAAATLLLYSFYWYHGVAFGPRFLSTLAPGLIVFTWRGAAEVGSWLAGQGFAAEETARRWLGAAIAFSIAIALAIYVPVKAMAEYRGLRGTDGALLRAVARAPVPTLILVDGPRWPDYASVYFLNSPDYRGPRVVALYRGLELDQEVADAYPGRVRFTMRRPATGGGGQPED